MSIKKVKTSNGDKWEVLIRTDGRESQRIRRRFERKVDAQFFLDDFKKKKNQLLEISSEHSNPEQITFKQEAEYWLLHSESKITVSHLKRVTGILNVLLPEYGNLPVYRLNPTFLSDLQRKLLSKDLSKGTVNRYTEVIVAILNHSVRHRRIAYSPANGFQKFRAANIEMNFWERAEAQSFLAYANNRYPKKKFRKALGLCCLSFSS